MNLHASAAEGATTHQIGSDESQDHLERVAATALLSALRALEDWISGAQVAQLANATPLPRMEAKIKEAVRKAVVLRRLVDVA